MDKNQVLDIFYKRQSIREYKSDAVINDDHIDTILRAAMAAPSGNDAQPWRFIVVDDREKMDKIMTIHPSSEMLETASMCIVVVGDSSEDGSPYWAQDCSAATENMLLAIANIGLGGVWLGVHPREQRAQQIREVFNIPSDMTPFCIVAIGEPNEEKEREDRFDEAKIYKNNM